MTTEIGTSNDKFPLEGTFTLQQPLNNDIHFHSGDEEMIKLSEGKFYWKGEEVTDKEKVYERFCEWMGHAEDDKLNN